MFSPILVRCDDCCNNHRIALRSGKKFSDATRVAAQGYGGGGGGGGGGGVGVYEIVSAVIP